MRHTSVSMGKPIEFINVKPVNPLISKCQIKVCYVGDEPNRNKSVISKEVAKEMANSLPGSPIVGFYNEAKQDFEEHNRVIDISNGKFEIKDTTRPYGFVDLNAKVWFQTFLDDDEVEHEYLVTEGYLWTGQYPECSRIIEKGNNHSMELDEKTLNAVWSKDDNNKPKFFIINEAIIKKLCILGDESEPCFEGSQITKNVEFSFDDGFKEQLFSMMNELKELIKEGGAKVFTRYAVEIGDALWNSLYSYIEKQYPDGENKWCSVYRVEGVYEDNGQKFAVLQHRSDMKYYRLDFSISEAEGFVPSAELVEVTKSYTPAAEPQFAIADVETFEAEYAKKKEEEEDDKNKGKEGKGEENKPDDNSEGNGDPAKSGDPQKKDEDEEDDEDKKKKKGTKFSLEEIPEYVELLAKYSTLEADYNNVVAERDGMKATIDSLNEFKLASERKDKEAMIATFYMLSDEDKKDVIDNIDTYSLDDIEAKLSIICVRNKVNFAAEDDKGNPAGVTYNLNGGSEDNTPDWVKAALDVAKRL